VNEVECFCSEIWETWSGPGKRLFGFGTKSSRKPWDVEVTDPPMVPTKLCCATDAQLFATKNVAGG
jgi:hypothetical protein